MCAAAQRTALEVLAGNGVEAHVQRAVEHCRKTRRPTFLHLRTTRIMGHAGTDPEPALDPLVLELG